MAKKLYVGNLPFSATEDEIRGLFAQYGDVQSVNLVADRMTGRPRGFGFVEMENAEAAIAALHSKDFGGRTLVVNEARPREERGGSGGGGGGGYGGGGGGRGGNGGGGGGGRGRRDSW